MAASRQGGLPTIVLCLGNDPPSLLGLSREGRVSPSCISFKNVFFSKSAQPPYAFYKNIIHRPLKLKNVILVLLSLSVIDNAE
jgi:hypothetical protein